MLASTTKLKHIHQAGKTAAAALQEVTSQDLSSGRSHSDIHSQALAQEDLKFAADLIWVLESRGAVGGDEKESLQGLFVEVGWFLLDHLNGHDTEGPHVDFAIVFALLDHFRSHPVGCADHGSALGLLVGEFGAEAEVG